MMNSNKKKHKCNGALKRENFIPGVNLGRTEFDEDTSIKDECEDEFLIKEELDKDSCAEENEKNFFSEDQLILPSGDQRISSGEYLIPNFMKKELDPLADDKDMFRSNESQEVSNSVVGGNNDHTEDNTLQKGIVFNRTDGPKSTSMDNLSLVNLPTSSKEISQCLQDNESVDGQNGQNLNLLNEQNFSLLKQQNLVLTNGQDLILLNKEKLSHFTGQNSNLSNEHTGQDLNISNEQKLCLLNGQKLILLNELNLSNLNEQNLSHINGQNLNIYNEQNLPLSNTRVHYCAHCEYTSKKKGNLRKHMYNHFEKEKCVECGYECKPTSLRSHMKTHLDIKLYKCNKCSYTSNSRGRFKIHLQTHKDKIKLYKCDQCGYKSNKKHSLRKHMYTHSESNTFQCNQCEYKCKLKAPVILEHMITHSDTSNHTQIEVKKRFNCSECEFACSFKYQMVDHMVCHSKAKFIKCALCPYKSYNKKNLKKHVKVHIKIFKN